MEFNKLEVAILEQVQADVADRSLSTLDDLQLALVGGGCGEVLFG